MKKQETKFKYGDNVKIIHGFHRGLEGKVTHVWSYFEGWFNNKSIVYQYIFDTNNKIEKYIHQNVDGSCEDKFTNKRLSIYECDLELINGEENDKK